MTASLEKTPLTLENMPVSQKLALPETFEQTMQQVKDLSDALENRIKKATTDSEREKYSGLLTKLKQSFVLKSGETVDGTQESIAKLRNEVSPDQQKLLEDVAHAVKHGVESSVNVAKQSANEVVAAGKKAAEALQSGNIDDAKKQLEGIKETVNSAGQKVMEYSGMKAFEKILEPLQTQGVVGIFAVIANFFKFLTGGLKWSEVVGEAKSKATDVATQAKDEATIVVGKAQTTLETFRNMSPEEREKLMTKMADWVADDISQMYLGGAKLSVEKVKQLREIIASSNMNPEALQKIAQEIEKNGKITIKNLVEVLGVTLTGWTELMWKIAFSGIVPLKHMAYEAVATGSKTAVGLTFYGIGLPPMTMTIEEINALITKHSVTGWEKTMALVQLELYRPLGIFWAVTSWILANMAKLGVASFSDTSSWANWFSVMKWVTGTFGHDYTSVFKEFEIINQKFAALPNNPNTQGMSKIIEELQKGMATATKNWKIIAILDEVKFDQAKFLAHPELTKVLDSAEIAKVSKTSNFQLWLKEIVGAPESRSLKLNNARMFFGNGDGVVQKYLRELDDVRWFQNLLVSSDKGGLEKINRLRDYVNTLKVIRQGDTVLLHLEDAKDVKNFQALRKLLSVMPEGIRWLGSILPATAFVVTMSKAVSSEASSGEIVDSLKSVLIPVYGGWQLIKNVGVNFDDLKAGKLPTLSDAWVAALGMTIMTFEGIRIAWGINEALVQGFRHGDIKAAARTLGKTAFMHPIDIAKSVGYASRWAMHLSRAAVPVYSQLARIMMQSAEKMPKKKWGLVVAGILAGTALGAAAMDKKDHLELEHDLKKQGYLDQKGDLTSKFYEEFQLKNSKDKTVLLHDLFWAMVDTQEKRPKLNFDETAREFAIVTTKAEEKSWWQSVLDTDTLFRDQLTKMGIDVVVISQEDVVKPTDKKTMKVPSLLESAIS